MKILIATLFLSLPVFAQTNFNLGSGTTTPLPNAPILQVQPQTDFWTGTNEATGTNFEGSDFGSGRGTGTGTGTGFGTDTGASPEPIPTRPQTLPGSIMNPNGVSPGWQEI